MPFEDVFAAAFVLGLDAAHSFPAPVEKILGRSATDSMFDAGDLDVPWRGRGKAKSFGIIRDGTNEEPSAAGEFDSPQRSCPVTFRERDRALDASVDDHFEGLDRFGSCEIGFQADVGLACGGEDVPRQFAIGSGAEQGTVRHETTACAQSLPPTGPSQGSIDMDIDAVVADWILHHARSAAGAGREAQAGVEALIIKFLGAKTVSARGR